MCLTVVNQVSFRAERESVFVFSAYAVRFIPRFFKHSLL